MSDEECEEELDLDMMQEIDFAELLSKLLATEEGETVATSLSKIANSLETQNKLLVKLVSHLIKKP
jgi:hypothetical protein